MSRISLLFHTLRNDIHETAEQELNKSTPPSSCPREALVGLDANLTRVFE
jgi:hypothetical protein